MNRRATSTDSDGSLDLLLDTICNTFGGVVFIAILVVVLVNTTNSELPVTPPTESSQSKLIALEIQREQTHERLRQLRIATSQQAATRNALSSKESRRLARQLQLRNETRLDGVQSKSSLLGSISSSQIATNRAARKIHERRTKIKRGKKELDGLLAMLKKQVAVNSRKLGMPLLRQTKKTPIAFFLKDDRLYAVQRPGRHNSVFEQLDLNLTDVEKVKVGGATVIKPRSGGGTAVLGNGRNNSAIKKKFGVFSSKIHYVQIFVWEGSFKSFAEVRKLLVDAGFNYDLRPMPKTGIVTIGSGSRGEVQ